MGWCQGVMCLPCPALLCHSNPTVWQHEQPSNPNQEQSANLFAKSLQENKTTALAGETGLASVAPDMGTQYPRQHLKACSIPLTCVALPS